MNERADATWIARSREETLFGSLYQRHYRAIRDFCRRRVPKDVVDDVVAETFLTAWRRIDDIPRGDQSLLWLYGVAYRVIGHHWRSAAPRRRLEERMYVINGGAASAADDAVVASDQRRLVLDAGGEHRSRRVAPVVVVRRRATALWTSRSGGNRRRRHRRQ